MEEQALSATLETLKKSKCIVILDSKSKEAETGLFFPKTSFSPLYLRTLRTEAWGELYIFVAHEVPSTLSFFFIGEVSITHPQLFFLKKILANSHHFLTKIVGNLVSRINFKNNSLAWVLATLFGLSTEEFL
jgi:3,4-dihydroxy-2-butanone 4-phosphate synthase